MAGRGRAGQGVYGRASGGPVLKGHVVGLGAL